MSVHDNPCGPTIGPSLHETRMRKREMELAIARAVVKFRDLTGLRVTDVGLIHLHSQDAPPVLQDVQCAVEL